MSPAKSPPNALTPIVLTMGEPAGIGGEIALKTWLARRPGDDGFFVIDDPARLRDLAGRLGMRVSFVAI